MKLVTGISPKYVKSWTVEKAIREIVQNYLDTRKEYDCAGRIRWNDDKKIATVKDDGPGLLMRHLALGISEKNEDTIGKYGEGLKLALLVLAREGRFVEVRASGKIITPFIENHEGYGTEVLTLDVKEMTAGQARANTGTAVRFECSKEELETGKRYFEEFLDQNSGFSWIERGRISLPAGYIYINGARVGRVEDAIFSYHLNERETGEIGNRDREVINRDKIKSHVRHLLSVTSSNRVITDLIKAAMDNPDAWEIYSGIDHYNIPHNRMKTWKRIANKVMGKNAVLSSNNEEIDVQAQYTGHKVVRVRSWGWEAALRHIGIGTAEKAAKSKATIRRIALKDLTDEERRIFQNAKKLVEKNYNQVGSITVAENLSYETGDASVEGLYRREEDRIYVKRSALTDLQNATHIIFHECVHKYSGADDCTAAFERALGNAAADIMIRNQNPGKEVGKKMAKKVKKNVKTVTRMQTAAMAIKKFKNETTVEKLITDADAIAVKLGMASNLNESKTRVNEAIQVAVVFGNVERDGDVVRKVEL